MSNLHPMRTTTSTLAVLCIAALSECATHGSQAEWISLFNGHDLSGWTQKGGQAKYSVADGCIVGETVPGTPNSFLCTEKAYDNFILELDFKVDPRLNSGVQIRSECFDQPTQVEWQALPWISRETHSSRISVTCSPSLLINPLGK